MTEYFPPFIALLFAYAVAFGIQNKIPFLYRFERLHGFLACTYCVGFHAGWMAWLLVWAVTGDLPAEGWRIAPSILIWAFCASAFCFAFDALVKYLENNSLLTDEGDDDGE